MLNEAELRLKINGLLDKIMPTDPINRGWQTCKDVTLVLNSRMRSTAGRAYCHKNTIHLNIRLLSANPEHVDQTLAHELAHIISYNCYGYIGHGRCWQKIMIELGYKPDRCHRMNTASLERKRDLVAEMKCECQTISITEQRVRRMLKGFGYKCRLCNAKFAFHSFKPEYIDKKILTLIDKEAKAFGFSDDQLNRMKSYFKKKGELYDKNSIDG